MAKVIGRFEGLKIINGTSKKTGKPYKMYRIVVDGTEYGIGFDPVKASKGDTVQFNAEENDRGYTEADPKSFRVVSEGPGEMVNAQARMRPVETGYAGDPKQDSIEAQVALKAATEIVVAQIAAGSPISSPSASVALLTADFIKAMQAGYAKKATKLTAAPQQKPERIEPEDENQDPPFDDDLDSVPY